MDSFGPWEKLTSLPQDPLPKYAWQRGAEEDSQRMTLEAHEILPNHILPLEISGAKQHRQ